MTRGKFPKYHRQKSDSGDRAYMTLQGRRFCLGPYDSPESRQEYKRILAEWLASGSQPVVAVEAMTVVELAAWFLACAKTYYRRPDGSPTTEISNFRQVIRPVQGLYGRTLASQFGPLALKAVRTESVHCQMRESAVEFQKEAVRRLGQGHLEGLSGCMPQGGCSRRGLPNGKMD